MPKPLGHYIGLLVNVVGRDGNMLLNVGPRPDGQIDPPQVERLREIGAWLGKYGQSIYATRGGPFLPGAYGASTHRDKTIYVHVPRLAMLRIRMQVKVDNIVKATTWPSRLLVRASNAWRNKLQRRVRIWLCQFGDIPPNHLFEHRNLP